MDTVRPCNTLLEGRVGSCLITCWLSTEHLFKGLSGIRGSTVAVLRDLPTILDTLVVLEGEQKEYIAAERKARRMSRDRERRKCKKLGEW
jgi:hypothetical protein